MLGSDETDENESMLGLDESDENHNSLDPAAVFDTAFQFLNELKYTALCTVLNFVCSWSCFTESLPREVSKKLRDDLFGLTMITLLHVVSE